MPTYTRIRQGQPGYGRKKFKVTGTHEGKDYTLLIGDPNMEIKRDDPKRRKAYRDRHNCDNPGPPNKARYHSCKMWAGTPVSKKAK